MRFSDIRYQDRALAIIRRALVSDRTHHAYLLEGPEGVGKELTGRALAARLLCHGAERAPDDDACGGCDTCRLFASGNHPDFHLIDRALRKQHPERSVRASKGLYLVVDLIRYFLIEPAGMKPTQGTRRVFLIRDAERMNEEAQNALLKTLEEPPGAVCLILVTSSSSRLLPTIRSRCQNVSFNLLPPSFVAEQLAAQAELSAEEAQTLAYLSDGRLGVALRWHRVGLLSAAESVAGHLDSLPRAGVESFGNELVKLATELATRAMQAESEDDDAEDESRGSSKVSTDQLRAGLKLVFLLIAARYRDDLVVSVGVGELCHLGQRRAAERSGSAAADADTALQAVAEAERMLDRNVAPQLVCEHLGVALSGAPIR